MPYLAIPDFKYGMDRRRKRVSGVPGTLWTLKNAHLSRGGDIERAKKFVAKYALPEGTFGLIKVGKQLYVASTDETLIPQMPRGVLFHLITPPTGAENETIVKVLDAKTFNDKIYLIAEFSDGNIYHFYDGDHVTDWDTLSANNSSLTTLCAYLAEKISGSADVSAKVTFVSGATADIRITARTPGVAFTSSASAVNHGADNTQSAFISNVQPNISEVEEVRPTGTVTITGGTSSLGVNQVEQITVNATDLMQVPVNWILSNAATANAVAAEINNRTSDHGFTAVAEDGEITITAAPGIGATLNGFPISVTTKGDVTTTDSGTMGGGVNYVAPVAQVDAVSISGTFEPKDELIITINGEEYKATRIASGAGVCVYISKSRVWTVAGSLLCGCKLNDPTDWADATAATGAVQINVANQSEGTDRLITIESYQGLAAVFSRSEIRLYQLDEDATQITLQQALSNTGTLGRHAVLGYGNNDVYYFDQTGIRSIRPRDAVNAPFVSDVGTALDTFIREHIRSLPRSVVADAAATLEPIDGRFWLSVGERIYVLSYFPASKVNAWSYYEPPEPLTAFVRIDEELYARGGDTIYLYGGDTGEEYPDENEQVASVEMPFLTSEKPAHQKSLKGYDTALDNEWLVELLFDPNDETKKVEIGRINRNTFHLPDIAVPIRTSAFAFNLTCSRAGDATLSAVTCHFDPEEPAK